MSIDVKKDEVGKVVITLDNGHFGALQKIVDDYKLKGEREAVGFMLAILSDAGGKAVEIDGKSLVPSKSILKENSNGPEATSGK